MSDFKDRLIDEKIELDKKTEKLESFFDSDTFKGLDKTNQGLLTIQHSAMQTYSECLRQRIINLIP